MGIMSVVGVGVFAAFAVSSDMLPPGWQSVFRGIAITAGVVLLLSLFFLMRTGRYFGPLFEFLNVRTGWGWTGGRTVRAISAVEDLSSSWRAPDIGGIEMPRAAEHRVLCADGVRSVARVLGDRPADLAVDRHDRRNLHAIGERLRRRHSRQPRRAGGVERGGGRRRWAWRAAARWRCSGGSAACCSRRWASRSTRATPSSPRRLPAQPGPVMLATSFERSRSGPPASAASACSSSRCSTRRSCRFRRSTTC